MLLGKCRAAGWRVAVRGSSLEVLEGLDTSLWQDGFLPHGLAGGPHDAAQPVLLGVDLVAEGFDCVIAVDQAAVMAEEVAAKDRVCILFDGYDEAALQVARTQWKTLTGAGVAAQYWAQQDGRWVKKTETAAT